MKSKFSARKVFRALVLLTLLIFLTSSILVFTRIRKNIRESANHQEAVLLSKAAMIALQNDLMVSNLFAAREDLNHLLDEASLRDVSIRVTNLKNEELLFIKRGAVNVAQGFGRVEDRVYFDQEKKHLAFLIKTRFGSAQIESKNKTFDWLDWGTVAMILLFLVLMIALLFLSERFGMWVFDELQRTLAGASDSSVSEMEEVGKAVDKLKQVTRYEAMFKLSSQVAHDIRSPLAALNMVLGGLRELPEETRLIIRNAAGRINDIANGLVQVSRKEKAEASNEGVEPIMLVAAIDSIVSEKRVQYQERSGIEIQSHLEGAYGLFARVSASNFARVISNLINNAVEAMPNGSGTVEVTLTRTADGRAMIEVSDNGVGIPKTLILNLGKKQITVGKAGGSGMGLTHAFEQVAEWGGKIEVASGTVRSGLRAGTRVRITLPEAPQPEWFVSEIKLERESPVVCVDHDLKTQQVFKMRFGERYRHFSSALEFKKFYGSHFDELDQALFLMEDEVQGSGFDGSFDRVFEVIEELGIQSQTILVTGRHEEPAILSRCLKQKIRMIPKSLAEQVPIFSVN